jgi:hypothetical protein
MSTYARLRATLDASLAATNTPNIAHLLDLAYTGAGEHVIAQRRLIAFSGTEIIETAVAFSAGIRWLLVYNEDATNFCTITHKSAGNGSTAFSQRIGPKCIYLTSDVTVATNPTLQFDTADGYVQVSIIAT